MSAANLVLLALLVLILVILSPNLRWLAATGICLWTWIFCLILSGVVGELAGSSYGSHALRGNFFDPSFFQALMFGCVIMAGAAVLTFLVLYRLAAYSIFSLIERRRKVELARPGVKLGILIAAVSPFVIDCFISAFRTHK